MRSYIINKKLICLISIFRETKEGDKGTVLLSPFAGKSKNQGQSGDGSLVLIN